MASEVRDVRFESADLRSATLNSSTFEGIRSAVGLDSVTAGLSGACDSFCGGMYVEGYNVRNRNPAWASYVGPKDHVSNADMQEFMHLMCVPMRTEDAFGQRCPGSEYWDSVAEVPTTTIHMTDP